MSTEGEDLVAAIRSTDGPFEVSVSGMSAELVDTKDALFAKLPLAAAIIALVTFAVLFLQFGSVVIPIKAVILNLLSLSATFGAMVWVFQDGNLSGRSDEHTSELQSLMRISYAVFCLKKKTTT